MVRRRRDESDAGNGMAGLGDNFIDLVAGQLAAFTGLGALRHFDLEFVGVDQIVGGDAESSAGYLLHGTAAQVAIFVALETLFVFAALAGVGHAADAVHGDGEGFMRFLADGTEAHGAGGEALDDFLGRLHFFERNGLWVVLEMKEAAQGAEMLVLIVDEVGVFLKSGWIVGADGVLNLADGERIEQVVFAALAVLIMAANDEVGFGIGEGLEGIGVLELGFAGEHVEAHAFDARGGP